MGALPLRTMAESFWENCHCKCAPSSKPVSLPLWVTLDSPFSRFVLVSFWLFFLGGGDAYSLTWEFRLHHQLSLSEYICKSTELAVEIADRSVTLPSEPVFCTWEWELEKSYVLQMRRKVNLKTLPLSTKVWPLGNTVQNLFCWWKYYVKAVSVSICSQVMW